MKMTLPVASLVLMSCEETYKKAIFNLRKIKRLATIQLSVKRDQKLLQNPHLTYAEIRKRKRQSAFEISKLVVGLYTYHGESIQDVFYESVFKLKGQATR